MGSRGSRRCWIRWIRVLGAEEPGPEIITAFIGFTQAVEAADPGGMILCVLALPVLYLVLRTIYGRLASAEAAKLEAVVDELARALREPESD